MFQLYEPEFLLRCLQRLCRLSKRAHLSNLPRRDGRPEQKSSTKHTYNLNFTFSNLTLKSEMFGLTQFVQIEDRSVKVDSTTSHSPHSL